VNEVSGNQRNGKACNQTKDAYEYRFLLDDPDDVTTRSAHRFENTDLACAFRDGGIHRQHHH